MKFLNKIKDLVSDKEKIADSLDLAADIIMPAYKLPADYVVRKFTGHNIKENLIGDQNCKLAELQIKAKTTPDEVVDIIRDDRNGFFQSSIRYEYMLLESNCLLAIYSRDQDEDDLIDARNSAIQAMCSDSHRVKREAKKILRLIEKEYNLKDVILKSSAAKRQFIIVVRDLEGCYDKTKKITWILTDHEVPEEFDFSNGGNFHYGQLYVQHPFLNYKYELIDDIPDVFLEERVQELIRLLAALGAVEIQITSERESSLLNKFINKFTASVGGSDGSTSASTESKTQYKTETYINSQKQKGYIIKCNPYKSPSCPNDRVWYLNNRKFNDFVKTRLESNKLEYSEEITSASTSNISSEFATDLNATMKELQSSVKIDIHYDQSKTTESKFNDKWKIFARFKPLEEFDK